jgi:leucyl aminopeptidase
MSEQVTPKIPTLTLKADNALTIAVDGLVVATSTDNKFSIVGDALPKAAATKLRDALLAVGATGARDEVVRIPGLGITKAPLIVAVGLGSIKNAPSHEHLRRAAGNATRSLFGFKKLALALPATDAGSAQALLEGAALGAYAFGDHRFATAKKAKSGATSIALVTNQAANSEFKSALSRAKSVVEATTFARNVINTSPLHMPPAELAASAQALLASSAVEVSVLDEKALAKGGYGGILAVGQGSSRPPRLIRMHYSPAGATKHIALVGKGITFDTGGISLKPPASMHEMKADMSGAAAVIATMHAVAALKLPIAVTAYAACAENMPGGNAQRPGDVISAYGGRTIEVLNTDAEGRLVMADALVRAAEDKPDAVFDIATLTGAAVVALGFRTAGVIGDEDPRNMVLAAAAKAGEEFWPMPMPEELRAPMDSLVADIANIGIREGGMLSAALFLKDFIADGLPWAHLDIAGPAFNAQAAHGYTHKGGVGFGIRTLLALLETAALEG